MGKKKVENLLKGVAITGATVGGASVLGSADLVYAAEMEEVEGELLVPVTQSLEAAPAPAAMEMKAAPAAVEVKAAPAVEEAKIEAPAAEEAKKEAPAVEEAKIEAPAAEEAKNEIPAAEEAKDSEAGPMLKKAAPLKAMPAAQPAVLAAAPAAQTAAPTSTSEPESQADTASVASIYTEDQISESGTSLSAEESQLTSTSEAIEGQINSASQDYNETSTSLSQLQSEYDGKNYNIEKLTALESNISELSSLESSQRAVYVNNNRSLNLDYYSKYARPLAIAMIKYNLVLEGKADPDYINSAQFKYSGSLYDEKNYQVIYYGVDGEGHEEYFDYVTADEAGNYIFKWTPKVEGTPNNVSPEDYAPNVGGINIVVKNAIDTTDRGIKTYEFKKDDNPSEKAIVSIQSYNHIFQKDENGHAKGSEHYAHTTYKSQASERATMKSTMTSLSNKIQDIIASLSAYQDDANENTSALASNSEAKSEWQANSTKTSESISTSTSQAASLAAVVVPTPGPGPQTSASVTAQTASVSTVQASPVIAPLAETQVPLAVIADDAPAPAPQAAPVAAQAQEQEVIGVDIEDEEVAKAATEVGIKDEEVAKAATDERASDSSGIAKRGILYTLIALITGKITYDKIKENQKEDI